VHDAVEAAERFTRLADGAPAVGGHPEVGPDGDARDGRSLEARRIPAGERQPGAPVVEANGDPGAEGSGPTEDEDGASVEIHGAILASRRPKRNPPRCDNASVLRRFGRALLRRCPNCGQRGIVRRLLTLAERCPRCGLRFERHEGYWLGAIAINTGATIVVFFVVFVAGMVATWPDVPWNGLLALTVAVNLVFPILFYPWSKTLWVAIDLSMHPPEERDLAPGGGPGPGRPR
jgi:uncharacterized protein (DUF983 family)